MYTFRYFRHEDYQSASCVTIQVGNVTADRELTYEYGVRSKSKNLFVINIFQTVIYAMFCIDCVSLKAKLGMLDIKNTMYVLMNHVIY